MIRYPAEFEQHQGTLMIWPVRPGSWGKDPKSAQDAFISIFTEILKSEDLYVLFNRDTDSALIDQLRDRFSGSAHNFCPLYIQTDDSWARDTGPVFVYEDDVLKGTDWGFNAWGGDYDGLYKDCDNDKKVASSFCAGIKAPVIDKTSFILEGGSIHSDGEGTLMVTESCLLSPGRNPHMSKEEIDKYLCKSFGASKVLWLPRGIYNDETNEHVDNVCAFTAPGEVVLAWTDNIDDPQYELSRASYEYLMSETDAKGRKIKIHKLPVPDIPVLIKESDLDNLVFEDGEDEREAGERLAASYVNFYFTNDAVLVPQFGGENEESDKRAVKILGEVCKGRRVVPIKADAILVGGGNIHCITQQIPVRGK